MSTNFAFVCHFTKRERGCSGVPAGRLDSFGARSRVVARVSASLLLQLEGRGRRARRCEG